MSALPAVITIAWLAAAVAAAAATPAPLSSSSSVSAAGAAAAAPFLLRSVLPQLSPIPPSVSSRRTLLWASASSSFGSSHRSPLGRVPRGGSTLSAGASPTDQNDPKVDNDEHDDEEEEERLKEEEEYKAEKEKARRALRKWRSEQQVLLDLRSTFLTEEMAKRGLPITTIADVSTAEGDRPPETVDWDCAMATVEEPKTCLYSFDAEPNTRVVAPIGTTQWISLSALNRLRRQDPTKVEPMWHSRYAILKSWFNDSSEFSLLQHVGFKGFLISNLLLDLGGGILLRSLLVLGVLASITVVMPILEYVAGRLLVSGAFWSKWYSWHRIVHAALPFKLLVGQMAWKLVASSFAKLEGRVRDYVVDLECSILEECVPLTVGPGSEVDDDDDEEEELELFGVEEEEEAGAVDSTGEYDVNDDESLIDFDADFESAESEEEEEFFDAEWGESESAF